MGNQRICRRPGKCAGRAEQRQYGVEGPCRFGAGEPEDKEETGSDGLANIADYDYQPAIEAIGKVSRRQRAQYHRQELEESRIAERERAASDRVDLPAYGDQLDLNRQRGQEGGAQVPAIVAMGKDAALALQSGDDRAISATTRART